MTLTNEPVLQGDLYICMSLLLALVRAQGGVLPYISYIHVGMCRTEG